jgi:hypothetical protein
VSTLYGARPGSIAVFRLEPRAEHAAHRPVPSRIGETMPRGQARRAGAHRAALIHRRPASRAAAHARTANGLPPLQRGRLRVRSPATYRWQARCPHEHMQARAAWRRRARGRVKARRVRAGGHRYQ